MVSDLKIGERVYAAFIVRVQKIGIGSTGKPFGRGFLEDSSGQVGFITFDVNSIEKLKELEQPAPMMIAASVDANKFNTGPENKLQVVVQKITNLMPEDDVSNLLPVGDFDHEVYADNLKKNIASLNNPAIRTLVQTIFSGDFYDVFIKTPAGKKLHHAYLGGLLQHTVDVTNLAKSMAETIGEVNMDLVVAGALLHDIGKAKEISRDYGFGYTHGGRLMGHIAIGVMMVQSTAEKLKIPMEVLEPLVHIILSHHGEVEKGSPVACGTKEAFIVHYADELNAVMNQFKPGTGDIWNFNQMLHRYLFKGQV